MQVYKTEEKCINCLRCVKNCASGVWRERDGKSTVAKPEECNRCGHCAAICPTEAVINNLLDMSQIRPIKRKLIDPEIFWEIAVTRRSVRNYRDESPSKETIEKMLKLARYSPTATNSQNLKFIVVQDKELMRHISRTIFGFGKSMFGHSKSPLSRKVFDFLDGNPLTAKVNRFMASMEYYIEQNKNGRDLILHSAPALLLILGPKNDNFSKENCNIAAANIANYAHALGLGTCFIGFLTIALRYSGELRKKVTVPEGYQVYASLVMGFPKDEYKKTVSRNEIDVRWID
jgi:nitroreductase/NAD-dependent dihydropyrimidine dehydrogenase PreA subunit